MNVDPDIRQRDTTPLSAEQLEALRRLPFGTSLRPHQMRAISAIEDALAVNQKEISAVMATGSGKTMTIMAMIHRMLRSGVARRVLYLTSSRTLERQVIQSIGLLEVEPGLTLSSVVRFYRGIHPINLVRNKDEPFLCVSTIQALVGVANQTPDDGPVHVVVPEQPFDIAICDGFTGESPTWRRTIERFSAIKIRIVNTDTTPPKKGMVYQYDLKSALNDNVLVAYNSARIRPNIETNPSRETLKKTFTARRVFLASAVEDSSFAHSLQMVLRKHGLKTALIKENRPTDERGVSRILEELRGGDLVTVLLSPHCVNSTWVSPEIHTALERRGVEIVPAVFRPCIIPKALADRTVVDLIGGPDNLLRALYVSAETVPSSLPSKEFEKLAVELLNRLHFDLSEPKMADQGIDFHATYHDSLGFAEPTEYLIQIKAQGFRASVDSISRLGEIAGRQPRRTSALLVTSGQLTSVAIETLQQLRGSGLSIQVMDGLRFKNHLLAFPDLIRDYFAPYGETRES